MVSQEQEFLAVHILFHPAHLHNLMVLRVLNRGGEEAILPLTTTLSPPSQPKMPHFSSCFTPCYISY